MPSRKWFAATVTSLAGWLTAFFVAADMHWTDPIKVGLITLHRAGGSQLHHAELHR
jgi:hypothetical protein